jgi:hypothetical protein
MKRRVWFASAGMVAALMLVLPTLAQSPLRVRLDRWMVLRSLSGAVTYEHRAKSQPAKLGNKLSMIGDGVTTGPNSTATFEVDTGIGFMAVAERTKVKITDLDYAPDNGRITRLSVTSGRVRLKLRKFTHKGSRLEIRTPAGLSGVRGTEFGVIVQPDGKTSIAVATGAVAMDAQRQSVSVPAGFQNLTIKGEAPSPAVPLKNDTMLRYTLEPSTEGGVRRVRLVGQVDPVNSVIVNNVPQVTDRLGRFQSSLQATPTRLKFKVVVATPLGKEQTYDVTLP